MNNQHILGELLPYRMKAVDILNRALKLQARYGAAPIKVCSDNVLLFEGNLNAFANGAIDLASHTAARCWNFLGCAPTGIALARWENVATTTTLASNTSVTRMFTRHLACQHLITGSLGVRVWN
jgi:hypothetical protein